MYWLAPTDYRRCSAFDSAHATGHRGIGDRRSRTAHLGASLLATTVTPAVARHARCSAPSRVPSAATELLRRAGGRTGSGEVVSAAHRIAPGLVAAGQSARGSGSRAARSTTSRSPAASRRSTRRCASSWNALGSNNIVRAQHWRHDDGPRPTLCVIHGFMGSSYLANGRFFTLPWYYRSGYDVLMYTLPFHGRRAEKLSPVQRFRLFRRRAQRFRRGDGPGRARLPFRHRLSAPHRRRPHRADRYIAGRLHLRAGGFGRRSARGRHPQLPGRHPRDDVRRMVPGQQAGRAGAAAVQHQPRRVGRRAVLPLPAELPAAGAQGPPDDHHRPRRSDGSAGSGREAMAAIGITARCTGSPAVTCCTSASWTICAG